MKSINLLCLLAITVFASAGYTCPNLSGEYQFEKDWNGSITVGQQNCDSITLTFRRPVTKSPTHPNGIWTFVETYKTDGKAYEGLYDSNVPATEETESFNRVQFTTDAISIKTFAGSQKKCGASYAFGTSDCKMFEMTLGYNSTLKSFLWTEIGFSWNPNGNYSNNDFYLNKVK